MRCTVIALLAAAVGLNPGDEGPGGAGVGRGLEDARPTAGFRLHHRDLRSRLVHLDRMVARLPTQEEHRRRAAMREIVARLEAVLGPHVKAEEAALYPAVDARAGGTEPFTAALRREHRILERWLVDLDREARRERPDPSAFARLANRLLGLVEAHFELEEEVLLPILDRTMTFREFQEEVAARMGPLHESLPRNPSPAAHRPAEPSRAGPGPASPPRSPPSP